ncbi:MAG: hypothetical protein APF84_05930 [Gracilibacter sp. BRH_c7a]|nr:MAG: hypothetical protein APF84_05930 [Gracilibacter sp. BRH_c7a]
MSAKDIDGIVVKVTEKDIVILCANGTFKNVPRNVSDQVPMLGQHFSYTQKRRSNLWLLKYASIASIFLLAFLAYAFIPIGDKSPAYIVAMDINPSIEITVDKKLTVQEISGLNNDGKQLIESMDITNQHLFMVTEKVIIAAKENGYLQSTEEEIVSITVIPLDEGLEPLDIDIEEELNRSLKDNSIKSDLVVSQGSNEMYQEAKGLNLSVNKFLLYQELYAQGIVHSPEEVRDKTIPQIREMGKEGQQRIIKDPNNQQQRLIPNRQEQVRENDRTIPETNRREALVEKKGEQDINQGVEQGNNREAEQESNQEIDNNRTDNPEQNSRRIAPDGQDPAKKGEKRGTEGS